MNWHEFFNMGGYAFYVWMSYGLTFVVLLANVISPVIWERQLLREIGRKLRRKKIDDAET